MSRTNKRLRSRATAPPPAGGKNPEKQYVRNAHCRSLKPSLIFRYHARTRDHANSISPLGARRTTHCSSDGNAQSVAAASLDCYPASLSVSPSVERPSNASRRVSSYGICYRQPDTNWHTHIQARVSL